MNRFYKQVLEMVCNLPYTRGPWVRGVRGCVESVMGFSGRKAYENDDGLRTVAMVQACGPADWKFKDEDRNRNANYAVVTGAAEMFEALLPLVVLGYAHREARKGKTTPKTGPIWSLNYDPGDPLDPVSLTVEHLEACIEAFENICKSNEEGLAECTPKQ